MREYKIVKADKIRNLESRVNALIDKGFEPFGSLQIVAVEEKNKPFFQYIQPMVRQR